MKTIVFLCTGFEEIEAITVIDLLRRAEIEVITVSLTGDLMVEGSHDITVKADRLYNDVDCKDADMLILPGGPGTKNYKNNGHLLELLTYFNDQKKYIAAICAAPSVIGELGILKGKRAVCYPGFEDKLEGATIGDGIVEMDENIITSRGAGTAIPFALTLIEVLKGSEVSENIYTDISCFFSKYTKI